MKEATFNFEPIAVANLNKKQHRQKGVTVNVKHGTITFSKRYVEENNLDQKYLKFFVDIKKYALGWTIIKQTSFFTELKEYKQLKLSSANIYLMSVATALKQFKFSKNVKTFKGLTVKKYNCTYIAQQTNIYYVTLKYNEIKT